MPVKKKVVKPKIDTVILDGNFKNKFRIYKNHVEEINSPNRLIPYSSISIIDDLYIRTTCNVNIPIDSTSKEEKESIRKAFINYL